MSSDMVEIATILEESTGNIHIISTSVGELTDTIDEISKTSGKAHLNTENAGKKMELLESDVQEGVLMKNNDFI